MTFSRKACGIHAGRAVERIHAQAAVIGKNRVKAIADESKRFDRFFQRVFTERGTVFFDLQFDAGVAHGDDLGKAVFENLADLLRFMRVVGGKQKFHVSSPMRYGAIASGEGVTYRVC